LTLALALALALTAALTGASGAFAAPAEAEAGAALDAQAAAAVDSAPTPLLVGAAVRDITPTNENGLLPIPGSGGSRTMTDVLLPLHTRVIAFQSGEAKALIVVTETGKGPLGDVFTAKISEHTGVPADAIFYTTTHSHAAPELVFGTIDPVEGVEPSNVVKWARFTLEQMLDAADEALAALAPATAYIGYGESYISTNREFTYHRLDGTSYNMLGYNLAGDIDPTLAVIRFDAEDGSPIAFIVNYACHAVSMIGNTYFDGDAGVDSDFPGQISLTMEEQYPGSVAAWTSGAAGDINPFVSNQIMYPDPVTGENVTVYSGEPKLREMLANIQLADIKEVLKDMQPVDTEFVAYADGSTALPAREGSTAGDVVMTLQLLRIGDIALIGSPGEPFHSIGEYIKDNSPLPYTLIFDNTWNKPGASLFYFPDDHAIDYPGFAGTPGYKKGVISPMLSDLANELIASAGPVPDASPTISDVAVGDVTADGFRVTFTAKDLDGVAWVPVGAFTVDGWADDVVWANAAPTGNKDEYSAYFSAAAHGGSKGPYQAIVWAYDAKGASAYAWAPQVTLP
jgi:hypothetical protein